MDAPRTSLTVAQIDWAKWLPRDRATLLFVIDDERVLLIRKKRGLGAGKINAPGGKLDPGETPEQAAVREVEEEVGVTPLGVEPRGRLCFQFVDGYSIEAHVFVAGDHRGEPHETAEAAPHWWNKHELPFAEMWQDDALWVPRVLGGESVLGRFVFDGDTMLDYELEILTD